MGKSHAMADQQNLILSRLSSADFRLLEPYLESADLPLRKVLERRGKPIKAIYFPSSGFASVVANGAERPIEVGLIGREGMTGLPVVLGDDRNDNEVYMQAPGKGHCIRTSHLRKAIDKSTSLHRVMLSYVHAFLNQATQTAVANGRSKIEERLARWLLMADDRIDGDELPLTHEFLAMMLGVRRPGVTMAIQALEREGVIAKKRARIVITNRKALEKRANGTYVPADYR
jgi:CRP-like cAMP-binding protein